MKHHPCSSFTGTKPRPRMVPTSPRKFIPLLFLLLSLTVFFAGYRFLGKSMSCFLCRPFLFSYPLTVKAVPVISGDLQSALKRIKLTSDDLILSSNDLVLHSNDQTSTLTDPRLNSADVKCDLRLISQSSKDCILDYILQTRPVFGHSLARAVLLCTKIFTTRLTIAHLHNLDDVKEAAKPLHDRDHCNVVTIGIGNDIEAEKQLRLRVPSCRFYGADPMEEFGRLYQSIGRFVNVAISDKDGIETAKVKGNRSEYVDRSVPSISLDRFLRLINVSVIDYMFMDAEGAEYKLLPSIMNLEWTICQISVELHGPLADYGMDDEKFTVFIENFIHNSSFIPLWPGYGRHMHLFFINTVDEYCIDKYFDVVCSDNVRDDWAKPPRRQYGTV